MAKARTWILIIFGVIGLFVVALLVMAGVGGMWVMRHVKTEPATATAAVKTFEQERARFGTEKPLISIDEMNSPSAVQKKFDALPASTTPAQNMEVLVWSPDSGRTVRISLPFWLLKLGRRKIEISGADSFNFDNLNIDVNQLERIGPKLIADLQQPGGEKILVWTK